jgi:hypothetical protein
MSHMSHMSHPKHTSHTHKHTHAHAPHMRCAPSTGEMSSPALMACSSPVGTTVSPLSITPVSDV